MHDSKASVSGLIAYGLWLVVAIILGVASVMILFGFWRAGVVLSMVSLVVAIAAAVAHVRMYVVRLSSLIRRLHGVEAKEDAPAL